MLPAVALALQLVLLQTGGERPAAAQTTPPSQQTPPPAQTTQTPPPAPQTETQLPVDLNKVKEAVNNPPKLNLTDKNPFRFYTETVRAAPKFSEIVGDFDLFNGPVPHAGMTHKEFVQSTRPKEMFSAAGFTPGDVIRWGILGYVEQKGWELIRKGISELAEAKTEAERKQIRALIEKELAALRGETIK